MRLAPERAVRMPSVHDSAETNAGNCHALADAADGAPPARFDLLQLAGHHRHLQQVDTS